MSKLGRNDRCWCGSGKKYKKCHLGREGAEPIRWWDAAKSTREAFSKKRCLAPSEWHGDCEKKIVRAHTVPKSSSLRRIARDGHVLSFVPTFENIMRSQGVLRPQSVGINNASTFTGFCANHDNAIFAPLEKEDFGGSLEQCFLLLYRAHAREVYTKEASAELNEQRAQLDRGRGPLGQVAIQTLASAFATGTDAGVRDNATYKAALHKMLLSADFSDVRALVITLEDPPPIMCSGAFYPEQDFDGVELQDIADVEWTPDMISVSSFHGGAQGHVVLSWLGSHSVACESFAESLAKHTDDELAGAFVRMLFEHFENIHMQPDWWDSLSDAAQEALCKRMVESANPMAARPKAILADDGVPIPPWSIAEQIWLG